MKKFFLIPLMTLMCSVMAWGVDVADKDALQAAVPATGSAEITLTGDISTDATALTVPEGVTVTLNLNNHSITVENTPDDIMDAVNNGLDAIVVDEGATLTVNGAGAITCHFISTDDYFSFDGGHAITSNGTLTLIGDVDITGGSMGALNAATSTVNIGTDFTGTVTGGFALPSSCVSGGYWTSNPQMYLVSGYGTEEVDGLFHVIESDVVYVAMNQFKEESYETLEAAINAAEDGDYIILLADAPATVVSKEIGIDANGFDYSLITAGEGYVYEDEVDEDWNIAMRSFYTKAHNAGYQLRDFLEQEEDGSYVLTEDADISNIFGINVVGNKTLTIPADKKILYQRQWDDANIVIPAGAKLTVLGSGTFQPVNGTALETNSNAIAQVGNRAIDVNGELVVGALNDDDNCPHFITTSIARGSAIMTNNGGVTTINNANVQAANCAIWNEGTMYINGGTYTSTATTYNGVNGDWYCYCIRNQAKMVLKNATVVANHGAVSCEGGDGTLEIHNCNLQARNLSGLGGVHYALYVCTKSVVSAYDTKFYSENASNTIFIGDNDSQNSFGLIYLYGGCKTDRILNVQKKRGQDDDILFPVLVSEQSEWYKRALIGGKDTEGKLLPANTVYSPIDEQVYDINGDPIEGKKYLFGVVSTATQTAEVDENATTIPWQQSSTWDASKSSESTTEVPTAATVVTVPEGKTVVISADPAKNNGVTDAKAEQIFLAEGASLTVETGTTLKVGEGGVNIANGGQLVVEPGAIVTVGATGLVTTEEEALVIEATEEDQGVFLLQPTVTENTQPKATVKLVTKCKQVGENEFIWERFAIPTLDGATTIFNAERLDTVHFYSGTSFQQGLYEWSDASQDWAPVSNWHNLQPFKGYQLTNNSKYGNVTYTFEGNLAGNVGQNFEFAQAGFGFFGNSYTGDIDIQKFMESFDENMQKTIWIYDYYTDQFKAVTEASYGSVYYGKRNNRHGAITDVRSMQAFLMNTFAEGASSTQVNYANAIWGNPKYGLVSSGSGAPAKRVAANEDKFTVYVAGAKQEDEVTFIRSNAYSAAFDNGVDASKWMNNGLNLYVATEDGELASVASDEIVDMTIAFQSGNETEYTLGFDNLRGEQFELRDVLTGATIQMTEGATYTFSQEANTTVPARFQIIGARKVATGVENVNEGANVQQKIMVNGVLYILRDNKWYSAQGQIVK